ncbi:MAG TPA: hypothetical protein VHR47_07275 [Bacillota bacterium]|nr:hypothetical protein [Bacillota bacterium]
MPNRILKESICTSESLVGLTPRAEVFFYRLIVNCDDYGRMDARTAILRSKCFPLMMEAVTIREIEAWLRELVGAGLIRCYQWADRPYLELMTWGKHQKIRAKRSKYPGPDGEETMPETAVDICGHLPSDADRSSRNPNPDLNPNSNPNLKQISLSQSNPAAGRLERVTLSAEEYRKLVDRYGERRTERMVERLADYKERTGRVYRSDYRAILNWVAKKVIDEERMATQREVQQHGVSKEQSAQSGGFDRERFLWKGRDSFNNGLP